MILAHISGIPIEETALSFAPVIAAGGGIAMLRLRERFARRRANYTRATSSSPASTAASKSAS
jgi:hypothetical protein